MSRGEVAGGYVLLTDGHQSQQQTIAIHPRSSSCSEGRNQRRIKTKQGGIKQGAGYGRRARLTLSYKQARVRLCGRSAVGLLTMSPWEG